jgi:oleate hydratase
MRPLGILTSKGNIMNKTDQAKAYLVGGGIASLSAAVLLIRDGGFRGPNICILEELAVAGGALDGCGDPVSGYVTRGGRMLTEETYACLWNVLDGIPAADGSLRSVKDEAWDFNAEWRSNAQARLIDRQHRILDASDLGFTLQDRLEMMRLLATPERVLGTQRIEDCFSEHFFGTNFWAMWRTTFAFQNWHSAIELKRYMLRFLQELPRIHTLGGIRRTAMNQYDAVVRPMEKWLREQGVQFRFATKVVDVDVVEGTGGRRIEALHGVSDSTPFTWAIGPRDLVFLTIGSMTADSALGGNDHPPELVRDKRDGAWSLWETMARKMPGLGRPNAFCGNVDESKWESFTLTMRSPLLVERIEAFSGNPPGTGGLMTFKDSNWLMSIVVPRPPHFAGQPKDVYTLWGYGLFVDRKGDYIDKTMAQASGQEILTELMHQLGFEDILDEVRRTTTVIPVMMPYITSEFERRDIADRPAVIPAGARNFALFGQYVEIPEDCVFTVEYSVRGAMHAVYGLLGLDKEIPPIYHGIADPKAALAALHTLVG